MDDFGQVRAATPCARYHFSPNGRISSSNVQALLGCW
jgi:hypothetical protein